MPTSRARRGRLLGHLAATAAVVAASATLLAVAADIPAAPRWVGRTADGQLSSLPSPEGTGRARILPAVEAPAGEGGYTFLGVAGDGTPTGYDPCRSVAVVVSTAGAPDDAVTLVADVLADLRAATGVDFRLEGMTDELPTAERGAYQPERYGDRWAPVLVARTDPAVIDRLAGSAVGLGGSVAIDRGGGRAFYESGFAYVDQEQIDAEAPPGRRRVLTRAVLAHELAHVAGLDHVADPTQLMNPETAGIVGYQDGDLRGLAAVGAIPCSTVAH